MYEYIKSVSVYNYSPCVHQFYIMFNNLGSEKKPSLLSYN